MNLRRKGSKSPPVGPVGAGQLKVRASLWWWWCVSSLVLWYIQCLHVGFSECSLVISNTSSFQSFQLQFSSLLLKRKYMLEGLQKTPQNKHLNTTIYNSWLWYIKKLIITLFFLFFQHQNTIPSQCVYNLKTRKATCRLEVFSICSLPVLWVLLHNQNLYVLTTLALNHGKCSNRNLEQIEKFAHFKKILPTTSYYYKPLVVLGLVRLLQQTPLSVLAFHFVG